MPAHANTTIDKPDISSQTAIRDFSKSDSQANTSRNKPFESPANNISMTIALCEKPASLKTAAEHPIKAKPAEMFRNMNVHMCQNMRPETISVKQLLLAIGFVLTLAIDGFLSSKPLAAIVNA